MNDQSDSMDQFNTESDRDAPGKPGAPPSRTEAEPPLRSVGGHPGERPTTAIPSSSPVPPTPSLSSNDRSWLWPITNLIGAIMVISTNVLANRLHLNGLATADVMNQMPVPFQPAIWTFTIWWAVYALLAVFVVYGMIPAKRHHKLLQRMSPIFLVANFANIIWVVLWHYERFFLSLIAILILLLALLTMYVELRLKHPGHRNGPTRRSTIIEFLTLRLPISTYLGWVIAVALTNLMMWLQQSGWTGGQLSYHGWAVVFLLGGSLLSALFAWLARDPIIPLVILVAYVGIANHAWGQSMLTAAFAIVFTVVQAGLTALSWIMSSEDARLSPMPTQSPK